MRWQRRAARNVAYAGYAAQLRDKLLQQGATAQDFQRQLAYQIGITDDWLQVGPLPARADDAAAAWRRAARPRPRRRCVTTAHGACCQLGQPHPPACPGAPTCPPTCRSATC